MSIYIHKSHNVSVLLYHLVCPTKYRNSAITEKVENILKEVCLEISERFPIHFLEIGSEKDHVHFLIQSVPTYDPTKIVRTVKSITAREIFARSPEVKKWFWGGEFWSDGYFISTVGKHGTETSIQEYVKNQGKEKEYYQLHKGQLRIFS
jgi:REP element-mobilizing transposase RayT